MGIGVFGCIKYYVALCLKRFTTSNRHQFKLHIMSDLLSSDDDKDETDWKVELQANRLFIVNHVDYNKLAPALQSALIIDKEDDELIKNPYQNPTSASRANAMVDLLLRRGKQNFESFLDVMGGYYPKIYTEITKKDPPPAAIEGFNVDDFSDEVLSFIFAKLSEKKQECLDLMRDNQSLAKQLKMNAEVITKLKNDVEEYSKKEEHRQRMEKEIDDYRQVAENFKSENYKVCMRLLESNDHNVKLRDENVILRLDIDKKDQKLRQLENSIHSERSQSIRLRRKLDTGPTEREVLELQRQIGDLQMRVVDAHQDENFAEKDVDSKVEILQHDLRDIREHYEESNSELTKLREELEKNEELKIKFYEESQLYQRQCAALNDDTKMYKERRDAIWQQLQEVEKERDQLMKERNEAQLTAQTYMEEKTKYRHMMRQLEEKHDSILDQLKQKEQQLQDLKAQIEGSSRATVGLDLIQDLPTDTGRRTSQCESVVSIDSVTGEHRKRKIGERRSRFPSLAASEASSTDRKERSLTDFIKENIFHKLVESDGEIHTVKITGKTLQSVEFSGGNETGIFVGKAVPGSYADVIGLKAGMKMLKMQIGDEAVREVRFRNCTLENVYNLFQEIEDTVTITVQYMEEEFKKVMERMKGGKHSGDSFYVRANYSLKNKEGYLGFEKGTVLHVVNTKCSNSQDWHAYHVNLFNGEDTGKIGRIPSYRYYVSSKQFTKPAASPSKPPQYFQRIFNTMPGSQDFCTSTTTNGFDSIKKAFPYTVVKKAPTEKCEYRPCSFVPLSLSTVLSYKLTTITGFREFDFPVPKSVKCGEQEAFRRVVSTEAISCRTITPDMHEFVTVDAVRSIMQKGKHCIVTYNEKCTSLETFNTMLHVKEIYPIVFHISSEKEKGLKILLDPDKEKDSQAIFQQNKREQSILDKFIPQYVTINVDKCSRLEDVVQQVIDQVSAESNKIIWISGKADVHI